MMGLVGTSLVPHLGDHTDFELKLMEKLGSDWDSPLAFRVYYIDLEKKLIQSHSVAGIILFTRNFCDKEQLLQLIRGIRELRRQAGLGQAIITVAHAGGCVLKILRWF